MKNNTDGEIASRDMPVIRFALKRTRERERERARERGYKGNGVMCGVERMMWGNLQIDATRRWVVPIPIYVIIPKFSQRII